MIFFILAHSILAASVNLMFSYLSLTVYSEVFEFYVRFLLPGCRKRCGLICIIWFLKKIFVLFQLSFLKLFTNN